MKTTTIQLKHYFTRAMNQGQYIHIPINKTRLSISPHIILIYIVIPIPPIDLQYLLNDLKSGILSLYLLYPIHNLTHITNVTKLSKLNNVIIYIYLLVNYTSTQYLSKPLKLNTTQHNKTPQNKTRLYYIPPL